MLTALFSVDKVITLEQENTLILEGYSAGEIKSGMKYVIPFNRSTGMTVPINEAIPLDEHNIRLVTFFDSQLEYDLVLGLNIGNEILEIHDPES